MWSAARFDVEYAKNIEAPPSGVAATAACGIAIISIVVGAGIDRVNRCATRNAIAIEIFHELTRCLGVALLPGPTGGTSGVKAVPGKVSIESLGYAADIANAS